MTWLRLFCLACRACAGECCCAASANGSCLTVSRYGCCTCFSCNRSHRNSGRAAIPLRWRSIGFTLRRRGTGFTLRRSAAFILRFDFLCSQFIPCLCYCILTLVIVFAESGFILMFIICIDGVKSLKRMTISTSIHGLIMV